MAAAYLAIMPFQALAQDCSIRTEVDLPAQRLYTGDVITIKAYPSVNRHIVKINVTVDTTTMKEISGSRIDLDNSAKLAIGTDNSADIVFSVPRTVQYITANVYDDQGACGVAFAHAILVTGSAAAVVVGINHVGGNFAPLTYAEADAESIAKHLIHALHVKPENIWLLTDANATIDPALGINVRTIDSPNVITNSIADAAKRLDKNSTFYFYFSGHQFVSTKSGHSGSYYFVLPTSRPADDDLFDMYPWNTLIDDLSQVRNGGRVIIAMVDSCFSGSGAAGFANTGPTAGTPADATHDRSRVAGILPSNLAPKEPLPADAVFTSSHANQASWEFDDLHHGVFTAFFLKAADWAEAQGQNETLDDAFYRFNPYGSDQKGVLGLTHDYKPTNPTVAYDQLPEGDIKSEARYSLWAEFAAPTP